MPKEVLNVEVRKEINWFSVRSGGGLMEHKNKSFGFTEGEELLKQMSD